MRKLFLFSTVTLKNVVAFLQNIFENNIVPILGKSLDKHCSCYCLNNSAKISTPTFPPPEFSFSHPFQAESHFCSLLPSCGNISSPSSFPLTSALPPFSKSRACFWFLARWVNNDGKLLLGRLDSFWQVISWAATAGARCCYYANSENCKVLKSQT